MQTIHIFGLNVSLWLALPLVYFVWVSLLLFIKRVCFGAFRRFSQKTQNRFDDILVDSSDFPLVLLIFVSGGMIIERMMPLANNQDMTHYFLIAFKVTAIIAIVMFCDKFFNALMKTYAEKVDFLKESGGVLRGVVRAIVIGLGLLILLDSFGVSITPLLASLGIGSLAIALALQPTLENFFAGMQLIIDRPIKVGHFVKLDSGEEGYVHKIGWRSTWVRFLANNMVVIPNKVLVNSKVINYYYPERELAVLVQVGVHYESDLEHVEKVTIEVGKETLKAVTGAVADFEPFIRYHTFSDFSINFSVILRAHEFVDNYLIKHEFIKRLHKRYAQEGIVIPFPIVAVNRTQEAGLQEKS